MGAPPIMQHDQSLVLKKKTRASRPKVKSGCGTCKIRHKKCDETKPVCTNCSNTGRICDGYTDPQTGLIVGGNQHRQVSRISPTRELLLTPIYNGDNEAQAYVYFEHSTSAQLAFALQSRDWTTCILQMSHLFLPVKHVVMALGTFSRRLWLQGSPKTIELDHFAREQYRQGISLLRKSIESDHVGVLHEKTLVTCFLFCMCEFMQGNPTGVQTHIRSGVRLFEDYLRNNLEPLDPDCLIVRLTRLLYMVDTLITLWEDSPSSRTVGNENFVALNTVDKWEGGTADVLEVSGETSTKIFRESTAAHQASKHPIRGIPQSTYTPGSKHSFTRLRRRQEGMFSRMEHWRSVVTKNTDSDQDGAERSYYRFHVWRMHYLYATMKLNSRLKIDPADLLESQEDIFIDVLASAERLRTCPLKSSPKRPRADFDDLQSTNFSSFPFALGITKPVLWVATHSLDPDLRDRAIKVLTTNPWTDGEWDTASMDIITMPWDESERSSSPSQCWSSRSPSAPLELVYEVDGF